MQLHIGTPVIKVNSRIHAICIKLMVLNLLCLRLLREFDEILLRKKRHLFIYLFLKRRLLRTSLHIMLWGSGIPRPSLFFFPPPKASKYNLIKDVRDQPNFSYIPSLFLGSVKRDFRVYCDSTLFWRRQCSVPMMCLTLYNPIDCRTHGL